jgi:glyoxylase-like metal-dependent hydrolase (beta-lactamase superfamily II)
MVFRRADHQMAGSSMIREFMSGSGARIFQLPVIAFPGLLVYAYLVLVGDDCMLIDAGSGFGDANSHLQRGLAEVSVILRKDIGFQNLTHILITHAHIDHFGGLPFLLERSDAKVCIHELDKRILTHYEERFAIISKRLERFFIDAGLTDERCSKLMELYTINKLLFHSVPVDVTYDDSSEMVGPLEILHVPGHSAGHVLYRLDDTIFSGDHILDDISPHQAPEQLSLSTGLDHYLNSLYRAKVWCTGARIVLPGHKTPIQNPGKRIDEIVQSHRERLQIVLDLCQKPNSIVDVSRRLFGRTNGYNVLLAIEETAAHIEYLYQRGRLRIANLEAYLTGDGPTPIQYVSVQ